MQLLICRFWIVLASFVVIVLSVIPIPETPMQNVPLMDKWVHFVMYGGVALAGWFDAWRAPVRAGKACLWLMGVVWPIVLGGLMEIVQGTLTSTRSGDWFDWLADIVGVLIAVPLAWLFVRPLSRVWNWPKA